MTTEIKENSSERLYKQIKQLSNKKKFKILELTQEKEKNISELSKELKLAFNKCSNYVTELEKEKLVVKETVGRNVYIKSKVSISENELKVEEQPKTKNK